MVVSISSTVKKLGVTPSKNGDIALVELIEVLQGIDTTSPLAKLNETSMPDNNGGRIKF
jgi:hypothetical protein